MTGVSRQSFELMVDVVKASEKKKKKPGRCPKLIIEDQKIFMKEFSPIPGERLAIGGKGIRCTVTDYSQSYQNFISTVSVYSHRRGIVLRMRHRNFHNRFFW